MSPYPATRSVAPVPLLVNLADALKKLERNGLVTRTVLPTAPVGVEYRITPLGLSLREPFEALYEWALANGTKLQEARATYGSTRPTE